MSKTQRQREGSQHDSSLSKNHGSAVRYRKRQAEEQEAKEEQEQALKELLEEQKRLGLYDDIR
jgi:hypothetical protein